MNRLSTSQYLRLSRDILPIESRERLEYNARLMNSPDVPFNLYDYFFGSSGLGNLANNDAIHFRGGRFTYNELRDYVDLWAKRLVSAGVRKGDRTAVLLFDSPEFVASFLASASISFASESRRMKPISSAFRNVLIGTQIAPIEAVARKDGTNSGQKTSSKAVLSRFVTRT